MSILRCSHGWDASAPRPAITPSRFLAPKVEGFVPIFNSLPFVKQQGSSPQFSLPSLSIPKIQFARPSIEGICNLLSGGLAGAFAAAVTCPLEVVKTQLQSRAHAGSGLGPLAVAAKIVREQGVRGLYRGL